jgi:lysophospholipase L1-like esterase
VEIINNCLLLHNIRPIWTTIPFTTSWFPNAEKYNKRVVLFNKGIDSICLAKHVTVIDLNGLVCKNDTLLTKYAQKDGQHLSALAYIIWRDKMLNLINK